jgi:hypothetical protein
MTPVKAARTPAKGHTLERPGRSTCGGACVRNVPPPERTSVLCNSTTHFARQSLAATTAKSWYLAIETRRLVDLAEQDAQLYGGLLKLAKIREAAGKVASLDIVEVSASLNEAEGQLKQMQALYSEARRNLEVLGHSGAPSPAKRHLSGRRYGFFSVG